MTDAKDILIDLITENFDYPIFLQNSIEPEAEYPESFFTFFNNDTLDSEFYDNEENATIWDFDLNFYSVDPELTNSVLMEAKPVLKAAGWVVDGVGYDLISDQPTHTGRGINVIYKSKRGK